MYRAEAIISYKGRHVWTAPVMQVNTDIDIAICRSGHVSGLCLRFFVTAGLDDFRVPVSDHPAALEAHDI